MSKTISQTFIRILPRNVLETSHKLPLQNDIRAWRYLFTIALKSTVMCSCYLIHSYSFTARNNLRLDSRLFFASMAPRTDPIAFITSTVSEFWQTQLCCWGVCQILQAIEKILTEITRLWYFMRSCDQGIDLQCCQFAMAVRKPYVRKKKWYLEQNKLTLSTHRRHLYGNKYNAVRL